MAAALAVAAAWVLYAVWRSPHRNDLATYGAFAVALVALAAGWIAWALRARAKRDGGTPDLRDLDHLADLLAEAVRKQWENAAGERGLLEPEPIPVRWRTPSPAIAGPVAAAIRSTRFPPLPGLHPVEERLLREGDIRDLHAVYAGLGSGRLVIAGAPGSGKTGAAVLLVLAALRHRQSVPKKVRPKVPVPVLFTGQEWDPANQRLQDWLVLRMQETYPLLGGKSGALNAAELIAAGKVALILDGLDEIAEEARPVALRALSQQAAFRVVVLARSAEMASASQRSVLEGAAAVELQNVDPVTAADFLSRVQLDPPPDGWQTLIDRIHAAPASPLAQALDRPLTLTLVRDTYREGDDVRKLLDFCDTAQPAVSDNRLAEDIVDHLLDRVLPAAYMPRPGEGVPAYNLHTAERALAKIAARMNEDGTRDLQWWRLPEWAPVALPNELMSLLAGGRPLELDSGAPREIGKVRLRHVFSLDNLGFGVAAGTGTGLAAGLAAGTAAGTATGTVVGIATMVAFGFVRAFPDWESTSSFSPLSSWRSDRMAGLVVGVVLGLWAWLGAGLVLGFRDGPVAGTVVAPALALFVGLGAALSNSKTWASLFASVQLASYWHTPVRLMRFLDDARQRSVLRTVGSVYQFRHARLQDRLAERAADRERPANWGKGVWFAFCVAVAAMALAGAVLVNLWWLILAGIFAFRAVGAWSRWRNG
ncbi:MAG TPA: hypothetical protein VH307_07340 [Streptosporangiaceae bacterium]|nr:hypothetical protein [Streptosporangiaceae bacterium]